MDRICIIADPGNRPFYESLDIDQWQLSFFDLDDALRSVGTCGYSIMVLDAGHSPDTGLRLLKRIKECCVSIPVIFLTDVSSEELAISVFRSGAREYFRKPVDRAELVATVRDLVLLRQTTLDSRVPHTAPNRVPAGGRPVRLTPDLPDGILKTVRYLEENLAEEIYLEEVAGEAGMSKFHFCRTFKDNLGMTPMQFLTISRIERAKVLMRKGGTSISSVVFQVGFNDISEFNRQFKKVTGMTPSAFRESVRQNMEAVAQLAALGENPSGSATFPE